MLPTFGARQLAVIDYSVCQAWVNELSSRRAPATVVKAAQILGKVLEGGGPGEADCAQPDGATSALVFTTPSGTQVRANNLRRESGRQQ